MGDLTGHINLKETSFINIVSTSKPTQNVNELVDDIVFELSTKNPKLVNDTEKGVIPHTLLDKEIIKYIDANGGNIKDENSRNDLIKNVKNYLFGYGLLQPLLEDPTISDVRVLNENNIRIKRKGKRGGTNIKFPSKKSFDTYCLYIATKNGGSVSELNAIQKLTDTRSIKDFILRINICVNPVNSLSPSIIIRKIPKNKLTLEDLINEDMINIDIYVYLQRAIIAGLNIIWCGKGASGKTTLMNASLDYTPHNNSILVMQEAEELHTNHPDCIFQTVKMKSGESDIEYTLRDETINGLLMDLDRMIIGEIKGAEAMEFFNAIYTGHVGWTSIHAPGAKEALNKAVLLMKYSGTDLPKDSLMEMLGEVDLVIYMKDFKAVEIVEIDGFDFETKEIKYNPVFNYVIKNKKDGQIEGYFQKVNPSCEKVKRKLDIIEFNIGEGA